MIAGLASVIVFALGLLVGQSERAMPAPRASRPMTSDEPGRMHAIAHPYAPAPLPAAAISRYIDSTAVPPELRLVARQAFEDYQIEWRRVEQEMRPQYDHAVADLYRSRREAPQSSFERFDALRAVTNAWATEALAIDDEVLRNLAALSNGESTTMLERIRLEHRRRDRLVWQLEMPEGSVDVLEVVQEVVASDGGRRESGAVVPIEFERRWTELLLARWAQHERDRQLILPPAIEGWRERLAVTASIEAERARSQPPTEAEARMLAELRASAHRALVAFDTATRADRLAFAANVRQFVTDLAAALPADLGDAVRRAWRTRVHPRIFADVADPRGLLEAIASEPRVDDRTKEAFAAAVVELCQQYDAIGEEMTSPANALRDARFAGDDAGVRAAGEALLRLDLERRAVVEAVCTRVKSLAPEEVRPRVQVIVGQWWKRVDRQSHWERFEERP